MTVHSGTRAPTIRRPAPRTTGTPELGRSGSRTAYHQRRVPPRHLARLRRGERVISDSPRRIRAACSRIGCQGAEVSRVRPAVAECGIRGREYKREHRDPASNIQRRSGCVLSFSGDSGRPSKSEGRNKKEERQPPLRAKVGATLVPDSRQN